MKFSGNDYYRNDFKIERNKSFEAAKKGKNKEGLNLEEWMDFCRRQVAYTLKHGMPVYFRFEISRI